MAEISTQTKFWLGCTQNDFIVNPVPQCPVSRLGFHPSDTGTHPREILDPGRGSEEGCLDVNCYFICSLTRKRLERPLKFVYLYLWYFYFTRQGIHFIFFFLHVRKLKMYQQNC